MKLVDVLNENISRKKLLSHFETMGIHKDEAEEQLDELIDNLKKLPDPIKLYRVLMVDDEGKINTDELGSHYSTNKRDLLQSHSYLTGSGERYYLVTVKSPKKLIDIEETLVNNILYPNENEITLKKKGRGVELISIREIK